MLCEQMHKKQTRKVVFKFLLIFTIFTLTACYPAANRAVLEPATDAGVSSLASYTQVYFYPKAGQSTEQQSRDHFECYNWAIQQTGFDPSLTSLSPAQRIKVVPTPPPGHDTISLAVVGAVLGALIGGRHAGAGALIGATGGIIAGAASDAARQEAARQMEEAYYNREQALKGRMDPRAVNFRRAIGACLEGRGYSVK